MNEGVGKAITSRGVPLTMTFWSASTATRVLSSNRVSRSCVTITTVRPSSWCSERSRSQKSSALVGVEPGRGLVEQQQRRVHDERARQRHALDHAARQVGRHLVRVLGLQPHHLQLDQRGIAHQVVGQGT